MSSLDHGPHGVSRVLYRFSGCTVLVDEERRYLETRFHDGTIVPAVGNTDPASVALAHDLGYEGDTWAMSRDHELLHTILAGGLSPTLWRVAHPDDPNVISDEEAAHEEARVLVAQRIIL